MKSFSFDWVRQVLRDWLTSLILLLRQEFSSELTQCVSFRSLTQGKQVSLGYEVSFPQRSKAGGKDCPDSERTRDKEFSLSLLLCIRFFWDRVSVTTSSSHSSSFLSLFFTTEPLFSLLLQYFVSRMNASRRTLVKNTRTRKRADRESKGNMQLRRERKEGKSDRKRKQQQNMQTNHYSVWERNKEGEREEVTKTTEWA
jgi:hypothetical protein